MIEKPSRYNAANVPTTDTGTASNGMIEARQVCRNRITTSTTSSTASSNVCTTALIESRTNTVGSYAADQAMSCGNCFSSSAILARTASDNSIALAPGDWNTPMPTAFWLSSCERKV
ncbi:hypothetical protein WS7_03280 [Xanthomonas citri pv. malvacearum str. GSPB2388]|nr:hypothetical protein WS7_03280 [Xanthomonas citri pv. malvacearum str. GSPB2388]